MEEQKAFVEGAGDLGGTMRLGLYPASLKEGSVVREAYGEAEVNERHRHRYEVNNGYRAQLEGAGLVVSGTSPDGQLVEFVELPRDVHPYYVSTQAHPEFLSRPNRAHPLFAGLIGAALEQQRARAARRGRAAAPPRRERGAGRLRPHARHRPRRRGVSLSAPRGALADVVEDWTPAPVIESEVPFSGLIFDVRRDRVDLGEGGVVVRDFIEHPGAVAVVALQPFDGVDHILLIRQYRHAARRARVGAARGPPRRRRGSRHWKAAARELAEEVDLVAGQWHVLIDELASAGAFPEPVRIFLARGLQRRARRASACSGAPRS